jgi:hypothetical protein
MDRHSRDHAGILDQRQKNGRHSLKTGMPATCYPIRYRAEATIIKEYPATLDLRALPNSQVTRGCPMMSGWPEISVLVAILG